MNGIEVAFEGRIGQAPTLRTSQAGKPWCSLSVGVGNDDDKDALQWIGVSVFGSQSEIVAALEKGARVYVEGRLKLDVWQDREGRERTGMKVTAWRIEPMGQIGHRKPSKPKAKPDGAASPRSADSVYRPLEGGSAGVRGPGDARGFADVEIPF